MKPSRQDVGRMAAALIGVVQSVQRASRKRDAGRLAALYAIGARPESSPKAISEDLSLHPSSVTRQIQALERSGYVKVTADPADGRSCRVSLMPKGETEIARLHEIGLQRFAGFVANWDAREVRTLTRLLMKFEQSKTEANAGAKPAGGNWRRERKK